MSTARTFGVPLPLNKKHQSILDLRAALLGWYATERRDLPWRRTRDPYHIWVSEIMLQQTRVAAVLEHYRRFLELFPTITALASARSERVLAAWSGLGYYRRARALHAAAQVVTTEMGGIVPSSSAELRRLPGIGRYTAAAIASIGFGERTAVVDGNVERVLARMDGNEYVGEAVWSRAVEIMSPDHPGDWNQAMMELGAVVCTPQAPRCAECPVMAWCKQRGEGEPKRKQVRHRRELAYGFAKRGGSICLVQRSSDASLMPGMWELPEIDVEKDATPLMRLRHSITNTEYTISIHATAKRTGKWVKREHLQELALTGLTRKVLRRLEVID